jgi:hypothetical protein
MILECSETYELKTPSSRSTEPRVMREDLRGLSRTSSMHSLSQCFASHSRPTLTSIPWFAGLADTFEPRRDVYAVAENFVALDQHVAKIDADAIEDARRLR